ncbi:hypothetical protein NS226_08330 [Aureimonas ureilytica]|uniref:Isochorismatase-like domain-containing protein n=1 Tax=Aureimonas ureilytica TaxID=401562 RepID=A0A175RAF1_9HYPH|nr:isochorismatase family protein [Aureimonas ureilytica]KTQ96362.1 hypothetical protein NS226_08330 [Aureimonas ureilytica]
MSLPSITAYDIPPLPEHEGGGAEWRFASERGALLIHDMQRYFVRAFPDNSSPMTEVLSNIALLLERCRNKGILVVYSAQPGGMTVNQRGLLRDFWGDGMRVAAEDRQVVPQLMPRNGDIVLDKWRYSAFVSSSLEDILKQRNIDQLAICGVYAHIGCLMTAADAYQKDIKPFLIGDAIADFNQDYHSLALRYASERCASIKSTRSLLADIDRFDVV